VSEEVEELHSNQEEAYTKIVLHILHASKLSPHYATVTDIFVLLLHFCQKIHQVFFDTGSADKWRLLDVEGIIADTGEDISHSSYLPRV
jgi:hypothetical protein